MSSQGDRHKTHKSCVINEKWGIALMEIVAFPFRFHGVFSNAHFGVRARITSDKTSKKRQKLGQKRDRKRPKYDQKRRLKKGRVFYAKMTSKGAPKCLQKRLKTLSFLRQNEKGGPGVNF